LEQAEVFFFGATARLGRLFVEVSRSRTETPHSAGLLWKSDRLIAVTSTRQHPTLTTDIHSCPPARFESAIPASERRLTQTYAPQAARPLRSAHA